MRAWGWFRQTPVNGTLSSKQELCGLKYSQGWKWKTLHSAKIAFCLLLSLSHWIHATHAKSNFQHILLLEIFFPPGSNFFMYENDMFQGAICQLLLRAWRAPVSHSIQSLGFRSRGIRMDGSGNGLFIYWVSYCMLWANQYSTTSGRLGHRGMFYNFLVSLSHSK